MLVGRQEGHPARKKLGVGFDGRPTAPAVSTTSIILSWLVG